ncbi:NUDIX domain-containing protein [Candidatus Dojkabacteria bacterium]|uniref:NUDIX domain-containing protein n=1 Tax=Candidatus Dojkabacteria bacterium TaxID=2099670 RepID=A0A955L2E2_9BACT|nr:NUDIX domain-containing protein [Candidatus Dojkabacteria bacterium]
MENHFIQMQILKILLFNPKSKFTDLKFDENIENNQLTFHINQLIKDNHLVKNTDKTYSLTLTGKEYANRMDTDKVQSQKQGKIGAITCCIRENKKGDYDFLLYTRKKQPFYDHQGFASGKVPYGQSVVESALRELKEEANLDADAGEVFMIEHHRVYHHETKELLEDKFFYFVRIVNPRRRRI